MSGLDPLGIKRHWEFLGSSIAEWTLFLAGIILLFMKVSLGFLFMVFWIENFFFWLIPQIMLEHRKFKRLNKEMERVFH